MLSLILQISEEQNDRNVTGNTEIYLTFLQLIRSIPTANVGLSNLTSELTQEDGKGKIKEKLDCVTSVTMIMLEKASPSFKQMFL